MAWSNNEADNKQRDANSSLPWESHGIKLQELWHIENDEITVFFNTFPNKKAILRDGSCRPRRIASTVVDSRQIAICILHKSSSQLQRWLQSYLTFPARFLDAVRCWWEPGVHILWTADRIVQVKHRTNACHTGSMVMYSICCMNMHMYDEVNIGG